MDDAQFQQLLQNVAPRPASEKRLPAFSSGNPTDWLSWRSTFLRIAELKQWNDDMRRSQILAAMEGLACRQVQTIDVDAGPMTWQEILVAYGNRFLPPAAGKLAREEFANAKQVDGESITAWHTRISELFLRAYPGNNVETDITLLDRFVLGLANKEVMSRTFDGEYHTMTEALQIATTKMANVKRVEAAIRADGGAVRSHRNFLMSLEAQDAADTAVKDEDGTVAAAGNDCFHCGRPGHYRDECPDRGLSREQARRKAGTDNRARTGQWRGRGRGRRPGGRGGAPQGGRGGRRGGPRARRGNKTISMLAKALSQMNMEQAQEREEESDEEQGN